VHHGNNIKFCKKKNSIVNRINRRMEIFRLTDRGCTEQIIKLAFYLDKPWLMLGRKLNDQNNK